MTIEELKKSATAGELCLIDKLLQLHITESVSKEMDRYHDILSPKIMDVVISCRDEHTARMIRNAFDEAHREFKKA